MLFWDESDRETYLRILLHQIIKVGLRIWAYALMTNHVHFVAVPKAEESLGIFFRNVDGTYADYFNAKYDQVGHLWGERFKSAVLDEPYLWNAVRYVERNPVRASMVDRAEDYRWSSAAAHCGLREDPLLSPDLPLIGQIADWSTWLSGDVSLAEIDLLRARTQSGRPCGMTPSCAICQLSWAGICFPANVGLSVRSLRATELRQHSYMSLWVK